VKIVCGGEVGEVLAQLLMIFVVVAPHRRLLDRPVHSIDLPIGPQMVRFGQPIDKPRWCAGVRSISLIIFENSTTHENYVNLSYLAGLAISGGHCILLTSMVTEPKHRA
jgi:hypothetical protein